MNLLLFASIRAMDLDSESSFAFVSWENMSKSPNFPSTSYSYLYTEEMFWSLNKDIDTYIY